MADYKEKASTSDQQNYNSRQSLMNDNDITQNSSKLPSTNHEMTTRKKNTGDKNLIIDGNELDHLQFDNLPTKARHSLKGKSNNPISRNSRSKLKTCVSPQ